MSEKLRQLRSVATKFETREDGEEHIPHITGWFARFDSTYEIAPGMSESIAKGAFSRTLEGGDIRALVNHDTTLVLGRTKAGTLELHEDEYGLWGDITINRNDVDAMNLYERVRRGDVDQCSFGFEIRSEESEVRPDGSYHWTLTDVELYEVSACTFPAYKETNISARSAERAEIEAREQKKREEAEALEAAKQAEARAAELAAWKDHMKEVLRNGTENSVAAQAD